MKLDEARVMAFPRKLVEARMLCLESQINRHLVKLAAFDFGDDLRHHFRREIRNWFNEIQALRFKPDRRTGSVRFYFDHLFDYPFGGVELENMKSLLNLIADEYAVAPIKSPEEMVEWLRRYHQRLAERLHKGEDVLDLIPE